MALHARIRHLRVLCSAPGIVKPVHSAPSINNGAIISKRWNHTHSNKEDTNQGHTWGQAFKLGAAIGLTAVALKSALPKKDLMAETEEEDRQEMINQENRIRQYSRIETVFDYFATYQIVKPSGKKQILMSVGDFYNAITPGSSLTHGTGRGVYTIIDKDECSSNKTYEVEKLPTEREGETSILNEIQKQGMLTYEDFCFLLNILATPRRYLDIAFHCFDVSADGNVEAKEFIHVMAKVTNFKGDVKELMKETHSGLITYLFGKDKTKEINQGNLLEFQQKLLNDVLWLEFTRYSKDGKTISDVDFCNHLLLCSDVTSKKKRRMINRVKKAGFKTSGVTFDGFKAFYNVLFGGADLERAMFFLDTEKAGINSTEFTNIARWVADSEIDPHLVELIYELLDEDGDKNLSIKEFSPVLFQWRRSRGFQNQSLQIALGELKI